MRTGGFVAILGGQECRPVLTLDRKNTLTYCAYFVCFLTGVPLAGNRFHYLSELIMIWNNDLFFVRPYE